MELNELIAVLKQISLYDDTEVQTALKLAQQAHGTQLRSPGNCPYLEDHVYPVAANVCGRYAGTKNLKTLVIAALLHDVLEDSNITAEYLTEQVGDEPAQIVKMVTKNEYENERGISQQERFERNKQYLSRVHGNLDAILIKLEDRLQNMQCLDASRVASKPEKAERYVKETRELFLPLAETKGLTVDYKALLSAEADRVAGILARYEGE